MTLRRGGRNHGGSREARRTLMLDDVPGWLEGEARLRLAGEVRAARRARGWTLADLAAAVKLDKGYLSRVERGLKVPSVSTVLNLARALGVPVAQLFGKAVDAAAIHVSRARDRAAPTDPAAPGEGGGYRLEALTTGGGRPGLDGFLVYPQPDFTDDVRAEHDGEELLFVVEGAVEVRFADRVVGLRRGDALQFPGRLPHQVRRTTPAACVLIAVTRD
ncbi:XRE family transcriptional regulator [uncultured Methylobacterium sp.]|uniref:helix-turn-helix domain-containing protein n=1 Tax=uncultured Methylobacterium sp. TaxID=157278 RepID=UPI00263A24B2|nr:XRE family transcriptional regulator [uncultured Methylobacterium sp.]